MSTDMKETLIYIAAFIVILGIVFGLLFLQEYMNNKEKSHYYPQACVVETVTENQIIVKAQNGNYFIVDGEGEDWVEGDICAMIMHDNNTPETVYDDKVVKVRYCGYIK